MSWWVRVGMLIEVLVPTDRRHAHRLQRSDYHQTGAPPQPMGTGPDIGFRRKDGSEFPVDVALSPVETATVRVVIAAVREVSDRKVGGDSSQSGAARLHEGALQALFGVSLNLQTAAALAADSAHTQRSESAINQIEEVIRDLRNYILWLRPGILADPPNQR